MTKHKQSSRRQGIGKVLRADDGCYYRVTQILYCEKTGERSARALVHKLGWRTFSGRSFDKLPPAKFNHCRSKFRQHVEGTDRG